MSLLASNCYRIASRSRRPPIRAHGPDTSSSSTSRSGELVCKSRKQRASLAIACSGYNASRASTEAACHGCLRCIREEARPASVSRFSDIQSQFDRVCGAYTRALTVWTPPTDRRSFGSNGGDPLPTLASCNVDDDDCEHPRSHKGVFADERSKLDQSALVNQLSAASQREDLVTALESYRHHLLSVLLTPQLCESLDNGESKPSSISAASRPSSRLLDSQYRWIFQNPDRIVPLISLRQLHTSSTRFAASSSGSDDDKKAVTKKTMAQRVKGVPGALRRAPAAVLRELVHLYHGFRLLAIDIKIASKLIRQILNGGTLSRREKNQLIRTVEDMFRLVPFLVFIIVPFMEVLLPVALKLFPNMLPSTFETEDKKRENQIKKLKAKVEIAKFLQATLKGGVESSEAEDVETAEPEVNVDDFISFLQQAQTSGKPVKNEDILKYSALFENEITLDNLERPQLIALCQLLELQPMGTNNFLRFQIRMQLRSLKADDRLIRKEGVDALAVWELQQANRARGMRSLGLTENLLQNQLKQWINLHLDFKIPATLLLLSRIIYIGDEKSVEAQLAVTMTKLTEQSSPLTQTIVQKEKAAPPAPAPQPEVIQDVIATAAQPSPPATTIVTPAIPKVKTPFTEPTDALGKIMLLKIEEEQIKAEKEDTARKEEERKRIEEQELLKDAAPAETKENDAVDTAPTLSTGTPAPDKAPALTKQQQQQNNNNTDYPPEKRKSRVVELNNQLEVIKSLASQMKAENKEGKEKRRLDRRVTRMITGMDKIIDRLQKDRIKHAQALKKRVEEVETAAFKELDEEQQKHVKDAMAAEKQRVLTLDELVDAVGKIQKVPDKDRIAKIVELLDEDRDGSINQEDVLRVLDLIGRENVHLSDSRMGEILTMVQKEALLEEVEKAEAQLESAAKVASEIQDGKQTGIPESLKHLDFTASKSETETRAAQKNRSDNNDNSDDIEEEIAQKKQSRNA